ncbi:MAG: integration host factor, actinobacterial type [Nitriliruptorales bacterium]|nr:integration host factor, actinobacterial type [Nitriliruptorales bacterium]
MSIPTRSATQRREALAKAVEARRARAAVKARVRAGEVSVREVIAIARQVDPTGDDAFVASMRVQDLLEALPSVGNVRARRLMEDLDIAPSRRLRGLGPRQEAALLDVVDRR